MSEPDIQMDLSGYGHCPVQLEGTVNGHPFYFHARWDGWCFSIALDPLADRYTMSSSEGGFYREGDYGPKGKYAASYMPEEDIIHVIKQCGREFAQEQADKASR